MKALATSRPIQDPKTTIVLPVTLYDSQGLFFSQFETRVSVGQLFDVAKDKHEAICQMLATLFPDHIVVTGRMSMERVEKSLERWAGGDSTRIVERTYLDGVLFSEKVESF